MVFGCKHRLEWDVHCTLSSQNRPCIVAFLSISSQLLAGRKRHRFAHAHSKLTFLTQLLHITYLPTHPERWRSLVYARQQTRCSCLRRVFSWLTNEQVINLHEAMASFIIAGGFGAIINCALASYFSTQVDLMNEIFVQPVNAMNFMKTVLCGFFGGTLVLFVWQFLKVRMVRFLLQRNSWFLHPKSPVNKV